MLKAQEGRCPLCGGFLLYAGHAPQSPREWEQWHAVTRKAMAKHHIVTHGMPGTPDEIRFTHAHCRRRHLADNSTSRSALPASEPSRLA